MSKHESKNCPRCKVDFECKVASILECQCSSVFLSKVEHEYVSTKYDDCLCVNCLMEVQTECGILNLDKKLQPYLRH